MAAVNVTFPGNLAQVKTAADLRSVPSTLLPLGALFLVNGLEGLFEYDPGSLAPDDGKDVLRPVDKTPGQVGRWIRNVDGLATGPEGPTGPANSTFLTRAALKAAPVSNRVYNFEPENGVNDGLLEGKFGYRAGPFASADEINVIKLNDVPLTTGALVRQGASSIQSRLDRTGAVNRDVEDRASDWKTLLDFIPTALHAGIRDFSSTVDVTDYVQTAINARVRLFAPEGRYNIDARKGLKLRSSTVLQGASYQNTFFWLTGGASLSELVNYQAGSAFGRAFDPNGANPYIQGVRLSDFAIIMNHPRGAITDSAIQIALDTRNITRSTFERLHIGNLVPEQFVVPKSRADGYDQQGYGFAVGTRSGGVSYCGGEVNAFRDISVWGAYKGGTLDDSQLSPLSSAHATTLEKIDVQLCHDAIAQEQRYTTGSRYSDLTLQYATRQAGNANPTHLLLMGGYNNEAQFSYGEAGANCDILVRLESLSKRNRVIASYLDAQKGTTPGTAIDVSDAGENNLVSLFENTSTGGSVSSFGPPITLQNGAYKEVWVRFHWDGSAIVVDGALGVLSVTRAGTGDYTVNFKKPFPSANYSVSIVTDTGASGFPGSVSINGASTSSSGVRFYTYQQNGATTTQIDPRSVWVKISQ